jgi:hypothetical protein
MSLRQRPTGMVSPTPAPVPDIAIPASARASSSGPTGGVPGDVLVPRSNTLSTSRETGPCDPVVGYEAPGDGVPPAVSPGVSRPVVAASTWSETAIPASDPRVSWRRRADKTALR